MKHIVTFSGGKDSLATLIFVSKTVQNFEVIFCDTGWESDVTMKHIDDVSKALNIKIKVLKGEHDFRSLSLKKKRVASTKARFCTDHLKIRPMVDYLLSIDDDLIIYQGIRKDESPARQRLNAQDDYYIDYERGSKKSRYRVKDVRAWLDNHTADVVRPIFTWNANQVFEYIRTSGLTPNPLYKAGFSRVGCFPCIMCRHSEVKQLIKNFPERIAVIRSLEEELGRTFFPPGYIPKWACTNKHYPSIDDVVNYLHHPEQKELFKTPTCQSVYALCE